MDKKSSKPSGAQFRKKRKEEEEKRAKDTGKQMCHWIMAGHPETIRIRILY